MQISHKTFPIWSGRILHFPDQSDKCLPQGQDSSKIIQIQEAARSKDKKIKIHWKKVPWAVSSMLWANFPWSEDRTGMRKLLLVLLLLSLSLFMSPS